MKKWPLILTAALLAAPASAAPAAENMSFISTAAWHSSYISAGGQAARESRSSSSLLYTDGAGRLTAFSMDMEDGVMTITIRQDGAVVCRRAYPVSSADFAVERREGNGRVYFLITAGDRTLAAEPDRTGRWNIRPADEDPAAPLPL